jgi:protein involved in polysaccharide export with SLBB domain
VVWEAEPGKDKRASVIDETTVKTTDLHGDALAPPEEPTPTPDGSAVPTAAAPEPAAMPRSRTSPGTWPCRRSRYPPWCWVRAKNTGSCRATSWRFYSLDDAALSRASITVRPDGYISLPFVPTSRWRGTTRPEATALVKTAYETLFKEPQVSLDILQTVSSTYYVLGEVQAPNEYPYTRPITVLQAITRAGGVRQMQGTSGNQNYLSRQAQLSKAFIIRHTDGVREVFEVDLQNLMRSGPHPSETPVIPGDVVFVPEGLNLVYIMGEVRQPDVFPLKEGMTLLQLLAVASGPSESTGRLSEVVLMREVAENQTKVLLVDVKTMLRTGEDFLLKPGDFIYIPRKRMVRAQEIVSRFTGTVSPIMSLYQQAWDTWYTKDRFDAIFDDPGGPNNLLGIVQSLRNFTSLLPAVP